jgi:hypothetical protein
VQFVTQQVISMRQAAPRWAAAALAVFFLAANLISVTPVEAKTHADPVNVLHAFVDALNSSGRDRALSLLSDNALISHDDGENYGRSARQWIERVTQERIHVDVVGAQTVREFTHDFPEGQSTTWWLRWVARFSVASPLGSGLHHMDAVGFAVVEDQTIHLLSFQPANPVDELLASSVQRPVMSDGYDADPARPLPLVPAAMISSVLVGLAILSRWRSGRLPLSAPDPPRHVIRGLHELVVRRRGQPRSPAA